MDVIFKSLTRAKSGDWMLEFSYMSQGGREVEDMKWLSEPDAQFILSAQRAARNEIRAKFSDLMLKWEKP